MLGYSMSPATTSERYMNVCCSSIASGSTKPISFVKPMELLILAQDLVTTAGKVVTRLSGIITVD